jgi:hypothetical protein
MDRKPNKYVEEVSAGALMQLPHLDLSGLGDRAAINLPVWDGENWRSWRIQGDTATEGKMAGVIKSNYLARSPHDESDVSIPFVEIMWQRASWPEILRLISGIENCVRKMGTSVAKMKHTYLTRNQLPVGAATEFATTEFEYSIVLCRTVFDLLQEIISKLWEQRVRLNQPELEAIRRARTPSDSFSKVCLKGEGLIRSSEELQGLYAFPKEMADQYVAIAPMFLRLRELRTRTVHAGSDAAFIFETDRGFCISKTNGLLATIPDVFIHKYNDQIVSVLPLIGAMIAQTIQACNSLMLAFSSRIPFPSEIAPGYRIYMKSPSIASLREILQIAGGASPWWDAPQTGK